MIAAPVKGDLYRFDYGACLYPEGMVGDSLIYFNHEDVFKVVQEGYSDDDNELMLEHIAEFTAWPILTGFLIGYIANRIMSGEGKGCCMNFIVGVVGSYAGTLISHLLNIELFGRGYLTNFIFCVLGAVTVLWIWKKIFD